MKECKIYTICSYNSSGCGKNEEMIECTFFVELGKGIVWWTMKMRGVM